MKIEKIKFKNCIDEEFDIIYNVNECSVCGYYYPLHQYKWQYERNETIGKTPKTRTNCERCFKSNYDTIEDLITKVEQTKESNEYKKLIRLLSE